jgi:hypothetical protein
MKHHHVGRWSWLHSATHLQRNTTPSHIHCRPHILALRYGKEEKEKKRKEKKRRRR